MNAIAMKQNPQSAIRNPQSILLAWQGWKFALPSDWSPIKIEGDFNKGFFALADLERQRIGVRWQTLRKKADVEKVITEAMRREVGQLACDESTLSSSDRWTSARLYIEPEPAGRDVWIAHCRETGRLIEVVYHAMKRDRVLQHEIVPFVHNGGEPNGTASDWSVFWMNVRLPTPMKLTGQRLNVGDLTLSFSAAEGAIVIRQIAAAGVALNRRPIDKWLATLGEPKRYKPDGSGDEVKIDSFEGTRLPLIRRRRQVWMRWIPASYVTYVLRDIEHDRLVLLRSPNDELAREVITGLNRANAREGGPA